MEKGQLIWDGVACRTIEEALTWVNRASAASNIKDIYACTSVQHECRDDGKGFRKAVRSSSGAVSQMSLFLDIDAKGQPQNSYDSLAEALAARDDFLKAIGVQPTMTVSSGGGIHTYIAFDRPIDPEKWKPLALASAEAAKQHELKCDTQCTVDVSRILRVPGTYNYKAEYGQPQPVQMIGPGRRGGYAASYIEQVLAPYKVGAARAAEPRDNVVNFPPRPPVQGTSELAAGIETNVEEIRSAALAIPPQAIASEGDWMKLARALAHHARVHSSQAESLYEILDEVSARAPGYSAHENRSRWERYISEAYIRESPVTIGTLFDLAKKHNWKGWQPPTTIRMQAATAVTPQSNPAPGPAATPSGFGAVAQSLSAGLGVSFRNIQHRQWLYGTYLLRGQVTFCAAPGGLGKTSYSAALAVELAANKSVLGNKIWINKPKVLYLNGEDDKEEMARRMWAFCLLHQISEQDIQRLSLLGSDDWRTKELAFMRNERGSSMLNDNAFGRFEELLNAIKPDVVMLDPLISFCGGGNVNDNAVIGQVMGALKRLANKFRCAILILHHTNKHGEQGSAGAVSGAAALVNLARSVLSVMPMTKDDANKFGVLPSESWRYFRLITSKANLAPPASDTDWYKFESVQAVVRVNLSAALRRVDPDEQKIRRVILDVVDAGKIIGGQRVPYSPSKSGASNERSLIPDAIAAAKGASLSRTWDPRDLEAVVERIVDALTKEGALVKETIKSGRYRQRQALGVEWSCTPWPGGPTKAEPSNHQTASDAVDEGEAV